MTLLADHTNKPAEAHHAAEEFRPWCPQFSPPIRIPVCRGLQHLPADRGRCVAALGVFDGVHRGHATLLRRAVELGRERGLPAVMVTFDPHPARVVGRSP